MAAAKSDKTITTVITAGAVLAALYVGYKLLTGRKSTAASSGGFVGGGYGGYGGYGSGYQYAGLDSSSSTTGLLGALLKALGGGKSGGGGGSSAGKTAGTPSAASTASYGNMQTLADFVNAGNLDLQNNLDWTGQNTLADSNFLDNVGLTETPMDLQTLDVSQFAQNYNPYADANTGQDYSGAYTDFAGGDGGADFSIPYDIVEGGSGIGDIADYSTD